MSTLKVTALKNPSSSANNIVLNTDGSITLNNVLVSNTYLTGTYTSNTYVTERYVGGTNNTKTNNYSNFDNIYGSQFFDGASATGSPATGWFWGIHHEHAFGSGYGFQLAVQNSATPDVYIRTQSANSWNSWQTLGGGGIEIVAAGRFTTTGATTKASNLSCTRTTTGSYTLTFGTARPTSTYIVTGQIIEPSSTSDDIKIHVLDGSQTTSSFQVRIYEGDNGGSPDVLRDRNFYITVVDF